MLQSISLKSLVKYFSHNLWVSVWFRPFYMQGQALGINLIMRPPVTIGSSNTEHSDKYCVSDSFPIISGLIW